MNEGRVRAHQEITKGQGADGVIDCVGMEASAGHGGITGVLSAVQEKLTATERIAYALAEGDQAVRPCGIVSVPGVYGGPIPITWARSCRRADLKSGQTHVKRYFSSR